MEFEDVNCWSLAEAIRERGPHRLHHLLSRAVWDAEAVLEQTAAWTACLLGDGDGRRRDPDRGRDGMRSPRPTRWPRPGSTPAWGRRRGSVSVAVHLTFASAAGYCLILHSVPDSRSQQGRWYSLTVILLVVPARLSRERRASTKRASDTRPAVIGIPAVAVRCGRRTPSAGHDRARAESRRRRRPGPGSGRLPRRGAPRCRRARRPRPIRIRATTRHRSRRSPGRRGCCAGGGLMVTGVQVGPNPGRLTRERRGRPSVRARTCTASCGRRRAASRLGGDRVSPAVSEARICGSHIHSVGPQVKKPIQVSEGLTVRLRRCRSTTRGHRSTSETSQPCRGQQSGIGHAVKRSGSAAFQLAAQDSGGSISNWPGVSHS